MARAAQSGVRSSLLAVGSQAGLDLAGFFAVGEVMGCVVQHLGWQGYVGCGWYGGMGGAWQVTTQVAVPGSRLPFSPYVDAYDGGWSLALGRMLEECRALGGDGVVGVSLEEHHLGSGNREFVALGTAVRSVGTEHVRRPFSTTLGGIDVAKLLQDGWVPAAIVPAIAAGVRHDDYRTRAATMWSAGNIEVPGYTALVSQTRAATRTLLGRRCADIGADGVILSSPMTLSISELEIGEGHRDHAAVATVFGTALAAFHPRARSAAAGSRPGSLAILPLNN
ncbi:MAG: hypothetical protein JWM85_619 [Acidimicrobiaceae bacterium]|nr:hypothetical protein [Acidimicrobiaceae bacterium]